MRFTIRQLLLGSRIIATMLFINIVVSSAVLAQSTSDGPTFTWICTQQGLSKVLLDNPSDGHGQGDSHDSQHCPFCFLSAFDKDFVANSLSYAKPDSLIGSSGFVNTNVYPLQAQSPSSNPRAPPFSIS